MWSIIDGKEKVEKLYNGILPDLESIYIHEFTIITGEDIELDIRFDIKDMPKDMPSKWIRKKDKYSSVCIRFSKCKIH